MFQERKLKSLILEAICVYFFYLITCKKALYFPLSVDRLKIEVALQFWIRGMIYQIVKSSSLEEKLQKLPWHYPGIQPPEVASHLKHSVTPITSYKEDCEEVVHLDFCSLRI